MFNFIARLFDGKPKTIQTAMGPLSSTGNAYYDSLVQQSMAASAARLHSWSFDENTMSLDPQTATLEEIVAALNDCVHCTSVEYPETRGGTHRAMARSKELSAAIRERFPNESKKHFDEISKNAMRAAVSAHGGPMPDWAKK